MAPACFLSAAPTPPTIKLSDAEAALYAAVTDYVKEEMNRADQLDGQRKGTVGFALTALQRRLASSPEAIYQSLKRRRNKLARRVEEEKMRGRGLALAETLNGSNGASDDIWESADALSPEDYENFEETVVDQATAAQTIQELQAEIVILEGLEEQARQVVHSGEDRKWDELSKLLQNTPEMQDADGRQRKLIIFTEHRDTLELSGGQNSWPDRQRRSRGVDPRWGQSVKNGARYKSCFATTPLCGC
jgi:hypothetical protein